MSNFWASHVSGFTLFAEAKPWRKWWVFSKYSEVLGTFWMYLNVSDVKFAALCVNILESRALPWWAEDIFCHCNHGSILIEGFGHSLWRVWSNLGFPFCCLAKIETGNPYVGGNKHAKSIQESYFPYRLVVSLLDFVPKGASRGDPWQGESCRTVADNA